MKFVIKVNRKKMANREKKRKEFFYHLHTGPFTLTLCSKILKPYFFFLKVRFVLVDIRLLVDKVLLLSAFIL